MKPAIGKAPARSAPRANHGGMTQPIIITIDGPAGTGKSSVSRILAARLGLDYLDTGAMYRAAAAIVLDYNVDPDDHDAVTAKVADADLHFDWAADPPAMLAWLKPIDHRLRQEDVERLVSSIASISKLREHMVRKQRIIAQQHPRLVSEGRDQGSIVFPDAAVKFYIEASPRIRAHRRAEQLRQAGITPDVDLIEQDIIRRDYLDSVRPDGPLTCPPDAVTLDTSNVPIEQVIEQLELAARQRIPALARATPKAHGS